MYVDVQWCGGSWKSNLELHPLPHNQEQPIPSEGPRLQMSCILPDIYWNVSDLFPKSMMPGLSPIIPGSFLYCYNKTPEAG